MVVETFTWYVHSRSSGAMDYVTLDRKSGGGYEQVAENGLNNVVQFWNISISGTGIETKEIRNFLNRHAGTKSFLRTPPLDEFSFCRGIASSISEGGGDYYALTATFTQAYRL